MRQVFYKRIPRGLVTKMVTMFYGNFLIQLMVIGGWQFLMENRGRILKWTLVTKTKELPFLKARSLME